MQHAIHKGRSTNRGGRCARGIRGRIGWNIRGWGVRGLTHFEDDRVGRRGSGIRAVLAAATVLVSPVIVYLEEEILDAELLVVCKAQLVAGLGRDGQVGGGQLRWVQRGGGVVQVSRQMDALQSRVSISGMALLTVGMIVGTAVGLIVGALVGRVVGAVVGVPVGLFVAGMLRKFRVMAA